MSSFHFSKPCPFTHSPQKPLTCSHFSHKKIDTVTPCSPGRIPSMSTHKRTQKKCKWTAPLHVSVCPSVLSPLLLLLDHPPASYVYMNTANPRPLLLPPRREAEDPCIMRPRINEAKTPKQSRLKSANKSAPRSRAGLPSWAISSLLFGLKFSLPSKRNLCPSVRAS